MSKISFMVLMCLLVVLEACDRKQVFEDKKDFPKNYWAFNNPADFEFEISDTSTTYNLLINVRNTAKYQYQNIYLQYYLQDSTGQLLSSELKNILLFNAKTGVPLGKGLGDVFDTERVFIEDYDFSNPGMYKLRIDQFMRQDSLPEILSVGFRIERINK